MDFPESRNSAMWADIVVRKDTIRVFNNHLQTTQIDESDREFLRSEPLADTLLNDKAMNIAGANEAGIRGIRFSDARKLRELLIEQGIDIPAVQ